MAPGGTSAILPRMKYFLAGGAIRNILMGVPPKDFDYVFNGSAEEFVREHPLAQKLGGGPAYGLHKHEITPLGKSIESNLLERDFTINSFLLGEDGILHMHPQALDDLKNRRIAPATRHSLKNDPLRVFRAARIWAQFPDFILPSETIELMGEAAATAGFKKLPAERVGQELIKALGAPKPGNFLRALLPCRAFDHWFSELSGASDIPAGPPVYHSFDVLEHIAGIMDGSANEFDAWLKTQPKLPKEQQAELRVLTVWMALCHDLGKVSTPEDILPHHYQHEVRGVDASLNLARRLKLSMRLRSGGALSARLHMKAGIYERLRPSTRVDLLMDAWSKKMLVPLFLVAQADSGISTLLSLVERELKAVLAVKLPVKWENRGGESGRHLREMRCAALIRLKKKQAEQHGANIKNKL